MHKRKDMHLLCISEYSLLVSLFLSVQSALHDNDDKQRFILIETTLILLIQ